MDMIYYLYCTRAFTHDILSSPIRRSCRRLVLKWSFTSGKLRRDVLQVLAQGEVNEARTLTIPCYRVARF